MYNERVMEHYKNPRNVGEIANADGIGIYMSDFCGDITKFWVKINDGIVKAATYKTQGCAASVARGSVLTELVMGKTVEKALQVTKDDIVSALGGLPEQKIHCSVLADDALKDALRDYLSRNNLPIPQELIEKQEKMKLLLKEMQEHGYILI